MFLSRNNVDNVYPCKSQFYYIKVGFEGVKIILVCLPDARARFLTFTAHIMNGLILLWSQECTCMQSDNFQQVAILL